MSGLSLRFRINALVTALVLLFVTTTAVLMLQDIRRQIREEIEATSRVTMQLLSTVVFSTQFIPAAASRREMVLAFLDKLGRVRAHDIVMVGDQGEQIYRSPPSRYKEGRSAPVWFSELVGPEVKVLDLRAPGGIHMIVTPEPSRAILDAWDDVTQLAWLSLGFFIAANLAVYWIIGRAFAPVADLTGALGRMERGDFSARVEGMHTSELRELGEGFNRMAAALELSARENRRLALAMRQSSDAILLMDPDGRVDFWNPAAERMFGYTTERMLGLDAHLLAPEHLRHEIDDELRSVRAGQPVENHDTVRRTQMGRSLEVSSSATPLIDPGSGEVIGAMLVLRDITERRRAEAATRELEASREMAQVVQSHLEEERRSLAMELHDELGQYVTAVKTIAQATANRTEHSDPQTHASSLAIVSAAGQIYDAVHHIIRRLRPVALERFGLVETLRDAVAEWRNQYPGLTFELAVRGKLPELPGDAQIALFRVAQECVTNVLKHAGATRISLTLGVSEHSLMLKVRDDGCGIPPERVKGSGRFGLLGMRDRMQALGGTLSVKRARTGGTEVLAELPLGVAQATTKEG